LRNPPIFPDPFTFQAGHSDAVIRCVCHFSTTAYSVRRAKTNSPTVRGSYIGDQAVAQKTASKTSGKRGTTTRSTKKSAASRSSKSAKSVKRPGSAVAVGDEEVTIDRRRPKGRVGKPASEPQAVAPPLERRKKVNRRRQIDPTTCERDYTENEVEFMNALDEYKRQSGRMFPTCSEVLEVVRGLGYVKMAAAAIGTMSAVAVSTSASEPNTSDACEIDSLLVVENFVPTQELVG
jgi:hypothetical protein